MRGNGAEKGPLHPIAKGVGFAFSQFYRTNNAIYHEDQVPKSAPNPHEIATIPGLLNVNETGRAAYILKERGETWTRIAASLMVTPDHAARAARTTARNFGLDWPLKMPPKAGRPRKRRRAKTTNPPAIPKEIRAKIPQRTPKTP